MKRRKPSRATIVVGVYVVCALSTVRTASSTPQFARQTRLPCAACHVHGPLLNVFGQRYFANGFRVGKRKPRSDTPPLWGTLGGQATTSGALRSAVPVTYAQTEIASYGYLDDARLLYHLAYQPSKEQTDIYLLSPIERSLTVQAGEIGLLGQYIPKLDISAVRPANLAPSGFGILPNGDFGPFAPGVNAFAVRFIGSLTGPSAMPYADGWKVAATVPFSNESSFAWQPEFDKTPTGVFGEVFRRTGLTSYGVNAFTGRDGRRYYGALGQIMVQKTYFEGGAAYASKGDASVRLASLSGTYFPSYHQAYGLRIDDQNGDFSVAPILSWMIGGNMNVLRLTAETRLARGSGPTTVVSAQFKF